jgi:hypothetical protein
VLERKNEMQFDGVRLKEQGVEFAIVVVKPEVLNYSSRREETRQEFARYFNYIPTVLMCQDGRGTPTYHSRQDIVHFLASVDPRRIPFKRYTIS